MTRPSSHPDCPHPVANSEPDYSGVECCLCSGRICDAVTSALAFAHADFMAELLGEEVAS
jgi:hypothetical protein